MYGVDAEARTGDHDTSDDVWELFPATLARETSFLFQRLSVLLQRFNSVLIHESSCFNDEDPDL